MNKGIKIGVLVVTMLLLAPTAFAQFIDSFVQLRTGNDFSLNATNFTFYTANESRIYINDNGFVGINTTTPQVSLQVIGDVNFSARTIVNTLVFSDGSFQTSAGSFSNGSHINVGELGVNTASPSKTLEVAGDVRVNLSTVSQDFDVVNATGDTFFFVDSSEGRVGIGTNNAESVFNIIDDVPVLTIEDSNNVYDEPQLQSFIRWRGSGANQAAIIGYVSQATTDFEVSNYASNGSMFFRTNGTSRLTIGEDGFIGVGSSNPTAPLLILKNDSVGAHLQFGDSDRAISNELSAEMMFRGSGIENAGLSWNPGTGGGTGGFYLARGGGGDPEAMSVFTTIGANGSIYTTGTYEGEGVNVSGTVQANAFVGDGSGLTGLAVGFSNNSDINVTNFVADNTLFVNNSRVGIGTFAPTAILNVIRPDIDWNASSGNTSVDNLVLGSKRTGTAEGDIGGTLVFAGPQSSREKGAAIVSYRASDPDQIGLAFYTKPGASVVSDLQERLRITHDGKIGIGTLDPERLLHLNSSGAGAIRVDSTRPLLILNETDTDAWYLGTDSGHLEIHNLNNEHDFIRFDQSTTDDLWLQPDSGDVGIRTTSPTSTLEVAGNVTVQETNNSFGQFSMVQFNSTCAGFRFGSTGGMILSCE